MYEAGNFLQEGLIACWQQLKKEVSMLKQSHPHGDN